MARPRKKIDKELVEKLAIIHCTTKEIAHVVGCSTDTLERRFSEVIHKGKDIGRMSLRRKMYQKAMDQDNTTMQIFLSKNLLGYSDNVDIKQDVTIEHDQTQIDQLLDWLTGLHKLK